MFVSEKDLVTVPVGLPEKVCQGLELPFFVTVQEFTLEAVTVMVEEPPLATRSGEAPMETVGTSTVTGTMFELVVVPPGPVQYI